MGRELLIDTNVIIKMFPSQYKLKIKCDVEWHQRKNQPIKNQFNEATVDTKREKYLDECSIYEARTILKLRLNMIKIDGNYRGKIWCSICKK